VALASRLIGPLIIACLLTGGCLGGGAGASRSQQPPTTTAPADTAPLVVTSGSGFVDRSGNTVTLRGVDVHTLDPGVYAKAAELGVNFMRVTVPWSDYEQVPPSGGRHTWNEHRLDELDQLVSYCADHDIEVLLDFHQYGWSPYFADLQRGGRANGIPRWLYAGRRFPATTEGLDAAQERFYTDRRATSLYADFAAMVAARYRTTPSVLGYEILNEPPTGGFPRTHWTTQRVVRWEAKILAAIRQVDPQRTVVFMLRGGPSMGAPGADLSSFGSLEHLALDVHDYFAGTGGSGYKHDGENVSSGYRSTLKGDPYQGSSESQGEYLSVSLTAARRWGIPLIVGEWGAFGDLPGLDTYQQQMVSLFDAEGVSWARWSLDNRERLGLLNRDLTPKPDAEQLAELIAQAPEAAAGG
jgi:cellulase (glycosyl hydrolase family 5)